VRPVRRDDAANGLVLHVLELREQHRLRVIVEVQSNVTRASALVIGSWPGVWGSVKSPHAFRGLTVGRSPSCCRSSRTCMQRARRRPRWRRQPKSSQGAPEAPRPIASAVMAAPLVAEQVFQALRGPSPGRRRARRNASLELARSRAKGRPGLEAGAGIAHRGAGAPRRRAGTEPRGGRPRHRSSRRAAPGSQPARTAQLTVPTGHPRAADRHNAPGHDTT
jgi:hypothetical protein